MNELLIHYIIEANLYLACFFLIYRLLLAQDKNFTFNRFYLLAALLLSVGLPLLNIPVQADPQPGFQGYVLLPAITIGEVETQGAALLVIWWSVLVYVYLAGVAFFAVRTLVQVASIIRKMPLFNSMKERKNGYVLVTTNGEVPTCSFFGYLFWDKSLPLQDEEREQILAHELVHIRQKHSIDIMLVEALRAVFWFNPAIHFYKSSLSEVHEYLADQQTANRFNPDKYLKLLARQLFKSFDFALSNNFHRSQTVKRIKMLESSRKKSVWLNLALLIPLLGGLVLLLSCERSDQDIPTTSTQETIIATVPFHELPDDRSGNPASRSDEVFTIVEDQPAPTGGMVAFYDYVKQNLKYPAQARKMGIEGKVFVQFTVGKDGLLTGVKAVKGIGAGCDQEAVRVIENSPAWKPGMQRGQRVAVRMILPITFKLN